MKNYFDKIRGNYTEVENSLIDEYLKGAADRRTFLRHASVIGLSLPFGAGLLGGLGTQPARAATPGGTLKIGTPTPTSALDPLKVTSSGGIAVLCQAGEFLTVSDPNLVLQPGLAESWKPNSDGTVWTFTLRKDVKFHNGNPMTADDVVATIERLADPANSSNSLSVFKGFLSVGGTKKVDDHTVEFHLDAPTGNWPYYVSSDNYNAIILPKDYDGKYEEHFIGTGPFKFDKYTPKVSLSFVRNDDYWGQKALVDRLEFNFFADLQSMVLAMQGGQIDIISRVAVHGAEVLLDDPTLDIISTKCSGHAQLHMNAEAAPFQDKRVRRAIALTLNREGLVKGLFRGKAAVGNDSPFAPAFPSTDLSVPQRTQNIAEATELVRAAGAEGAKVTLAAGQYNEHPDYAVLVQNAAKQIGINIDLKIEPLSAYYGKSVYGQSDWLDSAMGITEYGHRGTPNVFLNACLLSTGTWNAAHFKNKQYDSLVAQYVSALDLPAQRTAAKQIQELLLDETPIAIGYFFDALTPVRKTITGVQVSALSQLRLAGASFA